MQRLSVTSPYNALGYIDLATTSLILTARIRRTETEWRREVGPGKDVIIENLANGSTRLDDLQRFLKAASNFGGVEHWRELVRRCRPKDRTYPYVALMIGRWPLELTSLDRLLDSRVSVELYTTQHDM